MTIIAQDNFDTDTVGAIAPGWANKVGAWVVGTTNPVSGAASFGSTSNADGDVCLYTSAAPMAEMTVAFKMKQTVANGPIMGIVLRSDLSNNNNYTLVFSGAGASIDNVLLFKKVSGGYSQIGVVAFTLAQGIGSTVFASASISGSTIQLYLGVGSLPTSPIATFSDTSITAAGYGGLYNGKNAQTVSMKIDDFSLSGTTSVILPGAPTIGAATAGTGTGAIAFTPGTAGTSSTTSYIATASTGETATGTASPIAFGALSVGIARTFHVQGISADGAGAASAESNSITPTASSDTTPPTLSGTVTLGTLSSTSIVASWPAGADNIAVAGYERSIDGGGTYVSVGNVTSATISGLTPATTYPPLRVRAFDAAGNRSTPYIASAAGFTTPAATGFITGILFSPYTWDIQATSAKTINAGAYFSTIFSGTSCTLLFDVTGIASPVPQLSYRVDRFGPWINVALAASIAISIPADTADYANKPGHFLEVRVKSMTETQARWLTQATAVKLTGVTLDSGKTLTAPAALPLKAIFYGDSITEGVRTVNASAGSDTDRNDAGQAWSLEVGRILGAEVGNVGFGATGFIVAGSGSVPALPSSYSLLYSGVARSFASSPDFILLMEGTNDSGDVTAAATTVLNGLIAATTAKIIVLRPFNGTAHASQLQAAIAASTTPARCTYVDTAGWFNSANSSDALHPYGVENITHIAPLVANAVRTTLAATATLSARSVSVTLGTDASTAAANMTGLKVSFFDEATPDLHTVARYKSAAGMTNSAGVLSFTAQSTLAAGGTGYLVVQGAGGVHYNAPVVVS